MALAELALAAVLEAAFVVLAAVAGLVADVEEPTFAAPALVARTVVADVVEPTFAASAFVADTLVAPALVVAFFVPFFAATLAGAAVSGVALLVSADVALFTAMLGPLQDGTWSSPANHLRVWVRIRPSGTVLNGETPSWVRLVRPATPSPVVRPCPTTSKPPPGSGLEQQNGTPTLLVGAPDQVLPAASGSVGQPAPDPTS